MIAASIYYRGCFYHFVFFLKYYFFKGKSAANNNCLTLTLFWICHNIEFYNLSYFVDFFLPFCWSGTSLMCLSITKWFILVPDFDIPLSDQDKFSLKRSILFLILYHRKFSACIFFQYLQTFHQKKFSCTYE